MDRWSRSSFVRLAALLGLCLFVISASAADAAYCSSQNTAGDFSAIQHDYQSHGECTERCNKAGKYAFAVVLEFNCWCSNYVPEDQRDISDCSSTCPGFPFETCGNKDENLYNYIKLKNNPSGTVGAPKPTSTSAEPSSAPPSPSSTAVESTRDLETVIETVPASQEVTTVTSSTEATPTTLERTTTTTDVPTRTEEPSGADEPAPPQTSVRVITESGAITTQTVVTTPTSAPVQQTHKSSSNTGAIVGGVVGGVAGVIALVGGMIFVLWRRRRQQKRSEDPQTGVQRNTSTMSKAGLLRTEKEPQYPPPITTNFNRRQSRNMDQDSISPISGSDRRNSRHLVDQRLNPSTLFVFDNGSTGSVGSVDDSRDYHRPLNVRNPDLEA